MLDYTVINKWKRELDTCSLERAEAILESAYNMVNQKEMALYELINIEEIVDKRFPVIK